MGRSWKCMYTTKQPISYHTFIFPFLWNDAGKVTREDFKCCFQKGWREESFQDMIKPSNKCFYDQYHYFNQAARNAIYTTKFDKAAIVWNYTFDFEQSDKASSWLKSVKGEDNPAKYIIKKGDREAALSINGVRLKLFNTGVGMLVFELENYTYTDENDILFINEFGRRVFMPYLNSSTDRICSTCADDIAIEYNGKRIEAASGKVSGAEVLFENEIKLAPAIMFFLSNEVKSITASANPKDNEYFIEPIVDDRMFVACFYKNKEYVQEMSEWKDGTYRYIYDAENKKPYLPDNAAGRLYKMMFVGAGLNCHSRTMLKSQLEKHVYDRWVECAFKPANSSEYIGSATLTGITEYSLISVSEEAPMLLTVPFLTEYVEMAILVLAQRASLLAFERTISEIACHNTTADVETVQRDYIIFQSELLIGEVTPQQQGIELYNMMLESLFIKNQQKEIESQINSLVGLSSAGNEKSENIILFALAVLGIFDAVNIVFSEWFEYGETVCFSLSAVILIVIMYLKTRRSGWWK